MADQRYQNQFRDQIGPLFSYRSGNAGGGQTFSFILQENSDRILLESGGGLLTKEQV